MRKKIRLVSVALLLPLAVSGISGCDQVKSATAKFRTKPAAKPKVQGVYSSAQISEITKAEYTEFVARKNALVLVDYQAAWCGPCKILAPVLVKATEAHPGVVYVGKVDVDRSTDLAAENKVNSIPDVRIFKGGVEVDRFVGFPGEEEVLAKIAKHAEGIEPAPPGEAKQAIVKPFEKDWMPPGVTRQKSAVPEKK